MDFSNEEGQYRPPRSKKEAHRCSRRREFIYLFKKNKN